MKCRLLCSLLAAPLLFACSDDDGGSGTPDAGNSSPDAGRAATCPALGTELQAQTAPPRRGDMTFAYDAGCDRVFMFHGDNAEPMQCNPAASQFMDDGYTFDVNTQTWAEIDVQGPSRPLARARAVGAWDSTRNRFLLFGGRFRNEPSEPYTFLNDLWAFDPETRMWTELSAQTEGPGEPCGTGTTGRMNAVGAYDPKGDRFIVVGGGCLSASLTFPVTNNVSAFNLATETWENLWDDPNNGAPPRLFHSGALDTTRDRLYIFGGGGEDAFLNFDMRDMWYFDLNTSNWVSAPRLASCTDDSMCGGTACFIGPDRQTPGGLGLCSTPRARIKHTMAYDEARDQIVLFGGHDNAALGNDNDLWTFDPETREWTLRELGDVFSGEGATGFCVFPADFATVNITTPERRESHLFVVGGDRAIMYGGRSDCGLVNDTWILDMTNYTWTEVNPSFSGMTCYRSGRTDCAEPNARKCG